jgi:pyruvate,orthophosphate dikinase
MKNRYVYDFSAGDGHDKKLLGGKGANLCQMTQIGINVPPGLVFSTEACLDYLQNNDLPDGLMASVKEAVGLED